MKGINITGEADALIDLLSSLDIDKLYSPCVLIVNEYGLNVETFDIGKSTQLILRVKPDLEIEGEGKIPIEPEALLEVLEKKFGKSKELSLHYEKGKPLVLTDEFGSVNNVIPPSLKDCRVLPPSAIAKYDEEGYLLYAKRDKKGNVVKKGDDVERERAKSRVRVDIDELKKGILDMLLTGTDYVAFNFTKEDSHAISGHWGKKAHTSKTEIEAELEGEDLEIVLPAILGKVINAFRPSDEGIEIQGDSDKALIIRQEEKGREVRFLLTQPTKAD